MRSLPFNQAIILLLAAAGVAGCGTTGVEERTPELSYKPQGSGCGNIFVFVENVARTEALVVEADRDSLDLSTTPRSFRIEDHPGLLDLHIDLYLRARNNTEYCSDLLMPGLNNLQERWKAVRGNVEISISDTTQPFNMPYRTTIRLSDVVFTDPAAERTVTLGSLTIDSVTVGWLPG